MDGDLIRSILNFKTLAVVGCSPEETRPSHYVSAYMQSVGYRIIPVRPAQDKILGEKCYPNLSSIPEAVDVVVIFRKSEHVFPIVQEAIQIKAKAIWMQDGVEHDLAAQTARDAGLSVVMNDCIMRQHHNFGGPFRKTITTC